jgi:uncharacterized protein YjbI with pentapeptide repeats
VANPEHVERLKQDVQEWNRWRNDNPTVRPDLVNADLTGANLTHANLSHADLSYANLRGANLTGAEKIASLRGANLREADLTGADLPYAYLDVANLHGASLSGAKLHGAFLMRADLTSANLRDAELSDADLSDAKLRDANLIGVRLSCANLSSAGLIDVNLRDANLTGADLGNANLDAAKLSGTNLSGANLSGANLKSADLTGANLTWAFLREAVFADADLTGVIGLDTCHHQGPSAIDHRTLQKSGPLPRAFLRGVGLPERLIDSLLSSSGKDEYHSCFISYSTQDQEFADRLHADLQNNGVRCWFAPHDLRIGKKILDEIDAAIRLRDRVLLILSEHSINSDWVEDEVTAGFEEERNRGEEVLFPIRLDDAVMKTKEAWASKLRARLIGDFTHWENHRDYKRSFERVVRDLTKPKAP